MAEEVLQDDVLRTGWYSPYWWLNSPNHYMSDFVELCSEALLGRYLVVTEIDSGRPWLTDQQRLAGWEMRSDVVCSPQLHGTEALFFQRDGPGVPGYDEWFLFEQAPPDMGERLEGNPFLPENAPRPGRRLGLVSWLSWALHRPEEIPEMTNWFWDELGWVQPESYVSDGTDCLTFVTRNETLFAHVLKRLGGESAK